MLKRNSDIVRIIKPASATSEQYALFHRYLRSRHDDGGMVEMSEADYIAMIEESHIETMVVEYRRRVEGHGITGSADGPNCWLSH